MPSTKEDQNQILFFNFRISVLPTLSPLLLDTIE